MALSSSEKPLILHGSSISYFTGKMENYFRVRGIPYRLHSMQLPKDQTKYKKAVGLWQMPVVELPDGRWLTDTTKMIQWFESEEQENRLIPDDPLQAFVCLLIEDWADEWWWRPAMHYRWHYEQGARFASYHLAEEVGSLPLPNWLKARVIRHRQRSGYTCGDGLNKTNVSGVEADFEKLLAALNAVFTTRPFLLGSKPSLADIGFAGPFFRHFALDPVPAEIIRQTAPAVWEWVGRLWNARLTTCDGQWLNGIPTDFGALLKEIGEVYLPYLNANVDAVMAGKKRFDVSLGGVAYTGARYSQYRVWCLSELRQHFQRLPEPAKSDAQALLEDYGCWRPLWQAGELPLLPDQEAHLPFTANTKMVGVNE